MKSKTVMVSAKDAVSIMLVLGVVLVLAGFAYNDYNLHSFWGTALVITGTISIVSSLIWGLV